MAGGVDRVAGSMALAAALASWSATPTVLANGRYPSAQQLIEDPRSPEHLIVRATYGLLVTRDTGKRWSLICEQAVGYGGNEDPALGLLGDGTLLAGLFGGLALGSADGCTWSKAQGALGELEIVDVSVDPLERARALALGREAQHGLSTHRLWRTSDSGASWQRLGGPFGAELDLVATAFDVAASDPKRVYVSGLGLVPALRGVLLRTDNGGVGWTLLPIADTGPQAVPFFTAVAPNDRDTIYVRVRGSNRDRLLVSSSGGQSWRSVLEGRAVMAGFALSPDGTQVAVGFGLPDRPGLVDCSALGIWKASTRDLAFSKVFHGAVQCLTWTQRGLYACTHERSEGFQLGLSQDGGQSFASLMKLRSVQGLACPSPSMLAALCAGPWRELCPVIGTTCTGGDAGVPGIPPIGGVPGCLGDAGLPVAPGDAGSAGLRDAAAGSDGARPVVPGDAGSGAGRRDAGTDADAVSSV
ncbi:MAG: hypothetical protein MJD61_07630, partial [Proteobacteria bacterium]|nr:hypothetical protein [Pseudomonadota bacterium]